MDNNLEEIRKSSLDKKLKSFINDIEKVVYNKTVRIYKPDKSSFIVLKFSVRVPLPSRGTVNNIDIREIEPIRLLIDRNKYLYKAPIAFSNRKDFPKEKLSHLNPLPDNYLANFCIHRGNIDEWYAENTIIDYINRLKNWLRDAGRNRLMKLESGDQYESTRIIEDIGYSIYEPQNLKKNIDNYKKVESIKTSHYFLSFEELSDHDKFVNRKGYSIRIIDFPLKQQEIDKFKELAKKINEVPEKKSINKVSFAILLYPPEDFIFREYIGKLPNNFKELKELCQKLKLPIDKALKNYLYQNLNQLIGIPIITTIRRPTNIIDTSSNIEFLNFIIVGKTEYITDNNTIQDNADVHCLANRNPVDLNFAKYLSNNKNELSDILFIGAGAIGSKLILHLAKSGINNYKIIDNNNISPHNLIRHGLTSNYIGLNKAEALKTEIKKIFSKENNLNIEALEISAEDYLLSEEFKENYVIDTSASYSIQNLISDIDLSNSKVIRCEIAYEGKIGIIKKEGKNRSPRIDDLTIYLYDKAIENKYLSKWLNQVKEKKDNGNFELEEINIGLGCSSETLRLADDMVSIHSSLFSNKIKSFIYKDFGALYLTCFDDSKNGSIKNLEFIVPSFNKYRFKNDSDWQLRINSELKDEMWQLLNNNKPNETGGILFGRMDYKRKIIYVTRIMDAPPDSIKKPYLFKRGTQNVTEKLEEINALTGDIINYVGEWHTHPNGGSKLSDTDKEAISELRSYLDRIPYPTFILVVIDNHLHPYIFGPK
ncbi:MAG: ThiF family adenylyltransferase [bacterium]